MISDPARPTHETPNRWSPEDDYLADPAVAPMRALLAALVRRMNRSRNRAAPRDEPPADPSGRIHAPA